MSSAALRHLLMLLFAALAVFWLTPPPVRAQASDTPAINAYCEDPSGQLPLREIRSHTVITGPVAKTQIAYVIANKNTVRTEVGINFHLPPETVLTAFGYYYRGRFIHGKIYDTNEAWKIYTAVTSRGRDPGIMERNGAQDYHVQVYPVEASRDLRVVVELSQALATDRTGAHFELPLTQEADAPSDVQVHSDVVIQGHTPREVSSSDDAHTSKSAHGGGAQVRLAGRWRAVQNWTLILKRQTPGVARSVFSALNPSRRNGYYALSVVAPYRLVSPRITLSSRPGTDDTLPTRFGSVPAYGRLFLTGRYSGLGPLGVTIRSRGRSPLHLVVPLSGQVVPEHDNPAAGLWADKRIAALQADHTRNHRAQIVGLSKRFTVVSRYTALLAIPAEELAYYRKALAHQKIGTNTRAVGGGGGDPYIAVKAPADALQVVAVFPNGDVKNLLFDAAKNLWDGRFDIPFGTPAGEYRVTVIVVHKNGERSRFALLYQYLTGGPKADSLTALRAHPGGPFRLAVTGHGIARAVAVLPWGDRVDLAESSDGGWGASGRVPTDWPKGTSLITLVLLDGAHDRTEVSLDLDVR
jgi:hypothetical protein